MKTVTCDAVMLPCKFNHQRGRKLTFQIEFTDNIEVFVKQGQVFMGEYQSIAKVTGKYLDWIFGGPHNASCGVNNVIEEGGGTRK